MDFRVKNGTIGIAIALSNDVLNFGPSRNSQKRIVPFASAWVCQILEIGRMPDWFSLESCDSHSILNGWNVPHEVVPRVV